MKNAFTLVFLMIIGANAAFAKSGKIEAVRLTGDSLITIGEAAMMYWHFENADNVLLEDTGFTFSAIDSLAIYPQTTSEYTYIAVNSTDTVKKKFRIVVRTVNDIEEPEDIPESTESADNNSQQDETTAIPETDEVENRNETPETGGKPNPTISATAYESSANTKTATPYFSGEYIDYKKAEKPITFKIVSVKSHPMLEKTLTIKALPTDKYGRFLTNISQYTDFCSFTYNMNCETLEHTGLIKEYTENTSKENRGVVYSVAVDNSLFASRLSDVHSEINQFGAGLSDIEGIQVNSLNHKFQYSGKKAFGSEAGKATSGRSSEPEGLNSFYRNMSKMIEKISDSGENTVHTAIVFGPDNSSLIYDINDLTDMAISNDCEINIIGIGNYIEAFALKYIATQTGGRFYGISEDEIENIDKILKEIAASENNNYQMTLSYDDNLPYLCDKAGFELRLNCKTSSFGEEIEYGFVSMPYYARYQSLVIFKEDSANIEEDYMSNINLIADILKENEEIGIQLSGHTSMQTPTDDAVRLSLRRAVNVYKELMNKGVSPNQIRFKGFGNSKPVYFMENSKLKTKVNNRVEIKWLAPSLYPFEIITGTVSSEGAAFDKVIEWETLGYNSYYERYLKDGYPVYRVKLWGFKTEIEAGRAIQILEKDFDLEFVIE